MFRFPSLTLLSFLLLLAGCEKESINITEEIPETTDPVVIETQDDPEEEVFFLRMPGGETLELNGQGVIDENGIIGLVTSESSFVDCQDGVITFNLGGSDRGFLLGLSSDPALGQAVVLGFALDLPGLSENSSASIAPDCATVPATLEITTLTEDRIAGVYAAEFFTTDGPGTDCASLTNLGPVEVVFNVSLTPCQ